MLEPVIEAVPEGGLTRERVAKNVLQELAERRFSNLRSVLAHDLNGDGTVSYEEYSDTFHQNRERENEKLEVKFNSIDFDQDGLLANDELTAYANHLLLQRPDQIHDKIDRQITIFALDADKDGTVTVEEVTSGMTEQISNYSPTTNQDRQCALQAASTDAEIVTVSLYGSPSLSSVAIGDEDTEVQYIRVEIEPGDRPIYVTGASYEALIWHFVGATERVEHFAVAASRAQGNAVGVMGLSNEQVSLHESKKCLKTFSKKKNFEKIEAQMAIVDLLGRGPDQTHRISGTAKFRLPSGERTQDVYDYEQVFEERPSNVDSVSWKSLERFNEGGIAKLNPGRVIANKAAKSYSVLPQQAGLVQLISEGKLKMVNGGGGNETYLLLEPINRWPAGLAGAHSVDFIVPRHIPAPEGNIGHSSAYFEATGTCPGHSDLCRRIAAGRFDEYLGQPLKD